MAVTERDMLYRAKFVDDVTPGITAMQSRIESSIAGLSAGFRSAGESASAFTSGLRTMAEAENALHVAAQNQITDLKAQKTALQDVGYRRAQAEIKALQEELNPSKVQTFSQTWQELASKYYLVSRAAQSAGRGVMSLVDAASKYELLQARLNAVEGSSALGMRDFKEVQELAKKPGLGFEEAASTFATLRGMKVTAAETKTLINGIAQANASAAGTAEQFGRVMYQIQQSVSLGRLMQEDLRPIQQAIPTLGAAMQEHFGATQAEQLNKILEESGKSVREFWLEVAELGSKLPSTGDTIANNLDNMKDAWVRLRASLIDSGPVKSVTAALVEMLDKLSEAQEKTTEADKSRSRAASELDVQGSDKYKKHVDQKMWSLFHPFSWKTSGDASEQETSVGGAMGTEEALARMQATQALRDDLQARLKLQQEANDREIAENKRKAEKKAEDDAAAAKKAGESLEKQLARHNKASAANVIFSGPNEVTMRDSGEPDSEHLRNVQGAERAREAREKRELEDTQKMRANAQKIRMDWESALIEKKRQAHDEEMKLIRERFDVGQKLAADQVYKMLQGEFTIQGAVNATKDVMFRAFADTTTKWIEEQIIKMVFSKTAQAEETATSVAQASVVGAAWAAPSMATSIATFGGSTATGSAAWFTAMTTAQGYGMMPHERGGAVFGPVNASREEAFAPFVPGRIVPSYNSTTNHNTTNAQSITIHVHGGDEKTILRTLRKAGINGAGVSRS